MVCHSLQVNTVVNCSSIKVGNVLILIRSCYGLVLSSCISNQIDIVYFQGPGMKSSDIKFISSLLIYDQNRGHITSLFNINLLNEYIGDIDIDCRKMDSKTSQDNWHKNTNQIIVGEEILRFESSNRILLFRNSWIVVILGNSFGKRPVY